MAYAKALLVVILKSGISKVVKPFEKAMSPVLFVMFKKMYLKLPSPFPVLFYGPLVCFG